MVDNRRGIALLESMIALTIAAVAATTILATLQDAVRAERQMRRSAAQLSAADRVLTALSLLSRTDLERRLGSRDVGEFTVFVGRPQPNLFRLSVAPVGSPEAELLATVVHREGAP